MKIGICGGTFDPFHRGHLEPVLEARGVLGWDRIVYIPAYRQPFKLNQSVTSPYHRFAMTVLAVEAVDGCEVSPIELERGAVSYTSDTLEAVRTLLPDATIDWIIGDDNLPLLHEWNRIDRVLELANFVVLSRSPDRVPATIQTGLASRLRPDTARGVAGSIVLAGNDTMPISSTGIRARLRAGESIEGLVDPKVSRYIQQNRLYREVSH